MNDIRVIVVEDEAPTRDLLVRYILDRPELKLAGIARDGEEAVEVMTATEFDLVFMDINLPRLSGFEALEKVDKTPYVIFTTALNDRAIEAFELGAIDYLLKPFSQDRFGKSVERAMQFFKKTAEEPGRGKKNGLFITEKENYFLVPFADIIYVSSHDNASVIHTADRDYMTYSSLKLMETRLPTDQFFRIYKQYIINVAHVLKVQSDLSGNYTVFLKDEDESQLPIGRKYLSQFKEFLA